MTGRDDTSKVLDALNIVVLYTNAPPSFLLDKDAPEGQNQTDSYADTIARSLGAEVAFVLGSDRTAGIRNLVTNISAGRDECGCQVGALIPA